MENIYREMPLDKIPWNIESPPEILQQIVKTGKIKPCKAIELGCGTGNYALYLAMMEFDVMGIDFSETAIEIAKKGLIDKDIMCQFMVCDVLGDFSEFKETFDFAYDWELLHHIFPPDRNKYLNNIIQILKPDGIYLSVCFSEDSPQFGGKGKYRKTPLDTVLYFSSESEMVSLFKPYFHIDELKTMNIAGKFSDHKVIYAYLRKK